MSKFDSNARFLQEMSLTCVKKSTSDHMHAASDRSSAKCWSQFCVILRWGATSDKSSAFLEQTSGPGAKFALF